MPINYQKEIERHKDNYQTPYKRYNPHEKDNSSDEDHPINLPPPKQIQTIKTKLICKGKAKTQSLKDLLND